MPTLESGIFYKTLSTSDLYTEEFLKNINASDNFSPIIITMIVNRSRPVAVACCA